MSDRKKKMQGVAARRMHRQLPRHQKVIFPLKGKRVWVAGHKGMVRHLSAVWNAKAVKYSLSIAQPSIFRIRDKCVVGSKAQSRMLPFRRTNSYDTALNMGAL